MRERSNDTLFLSSMMRYPSPAPIKILSFFVIMRFMYGRLCYRFKRESFKHRDRTYMRDVT